MTERQVYLDNNASTRVDPRVLEAMHPYLQENFGNASSIHSYGQRARAAIEEARQQVADLIGARPREIIFTSGGTESDNTALRGLVFCNRSRGNHIFTTSIEHPAVLRTCEQLEKEGCQVTTIPVDQKGLVQLDELGKALTDETILVSVMHANNEVGSIQPIAEIASMLRERRIAFHTDAVQSVGKIPVNVQELGVDLLSLSGHKFHGPKGVGALWVDADTSMHPLLFGGAHERKRRAGTENVPGIVGMGKACELALSGLNDFSSRVGSLRDLLEEGILQKVPGTVVNGTRARRMPHVSNISFRSVEGEALLISLDFQGIAVSTGAACSSGALEPSHVLRAIRLNKELLDGAIRFSLSRMTTLSEIDCVLKILPGTVERMREISPLYREG